MKKIYIVLGFMLLSGAFTFCLGTLNVLNSSYPLWLKIFDASAGITLLLVTLLFIWIEFKANKKNLVETNKAEGSKLMEKKQAALELKTPAQILGLPNPLIFKVEGVMEFENKVFAAVVEVFNNLKIQDGELTTNEIELLKTAFKNKNCFLNDVGVFDISYDRHQGGLIIYKNMVIYANSQKGALFPGVVICPIKEGINVSNVCNYYTDELRNGFYDDSRPEAKKFVDMLIGLTGKNLTTVSWQNPKDCYLIKTKVQKAGNCTKSNPVKALQGLLLCMQALKFKAQDASELTILDVQGAAKEINKYKETYKKITKSLRENAARKFIEVLQKYKQDLDKSLFVKYFLAFLIKFESKPKLREIKSMSDLHVMVSQIPEVNILHLIHKSQSVPQELLSAIKDIKYETLIGEKTISEIIELYHEDGELKIIEDVSKEEIGITLLSIFKNVIKLNNPPFKVIQAILEKLPKEESEDNCYEPYLEEVIKAFDGSKKSINLLSILLAKYKSKEEEKMKKESGSAEAFYNKTGRIYDKDLAYKLIKLVYLSSFSNMNRSCLQYCLKDIGIYAVQCLKEFFTDMVIVISEKRPEKPESEDKVTFYKELIQYKKTIAICECKEKTSEEKISSILDTLYPESQLEAKQDHSFSWK